MVWVVPELLSGPDHARPRATVASPSATRSYVIRLTGNEPEVANATPGAAKAAHAPTVAAGAGEVSSAVPTDAKRVRTPTAAAVTRAPAVGGSARKTTSAARAEGATSASRTASHGVTVHHESMHGGSVHPTAHATVSAEPTRVRTHATHERRPAAPARHASRAREQGSRVRWSVQVASFLARDHAERFERELRARGFRASISRGHSRGRLWYRVRVGPEPDRRAALALARRLRAAGHAGELVRGS